MFFATTAIDSFWDKSKKIIFLGPGCLLLNQQHVWEKLDYEVMASPWRDRDTLFQAGLYTYETYHYILEKLADYLNRVHNRTHSRRFWQIIIGPWLLHFIEAFYDRYICVKEALAYCENFETILLEPSCYIIPKSTIDFFSLYSDDFYNLQLYSQIMTSLGIKAPVKRYNPESNNESLNNRHGLTKIVKKFIFICSCRLAQNSSILLWDTYLNNNYVFKYVIRSRFKALPILYQDIQQPKYKAVKDLKRIGLSELSYRDEFTKIAIKNLPDNFPTLYLEGFHDYLEKKFLSFKRQPTILLSATGWYFNENLKFLAAHWSETGTVLCGYQHGGLYGTAKWMPPENHEIEISDNYYTCGWERGDSKKTKVLPNPKISTLQKRTAKNKIGDCYLFVGTSHPRYLSRMFSTPVGDAFEEYLEWRNIFIRNLSEDLRHKLLIRLNLVDYGWEQNQRILREFNDISFDNHKIDFLKQLQKVKIAIIDHPVTTMLESLVANVPTILFWNPQCWELRKSAVEYFQMLADIGIWHQTPESAAYFLGQNAANPGLWWDKTETQSGRKKFLHKFAYGAFDWADQWLKQMNLILKQKNWTSPHLDRIPIQPN